MFGYIAFKENMAVPEQTNTTIDFLSLEFTFYSTCLKLSHLPPETLELSCVLYFYTRMLRHPLLPIYY